MAKDTKTSVAKRPTSRVNVRVKRLGVRQRLAELADNRALGWGVVACAVFILVVGGLTAWTREQPLIADGQMMRDTRLARVEFNTLDLQQTEMRREAARQNTPRVYSADLPVLEELRASIANLPRTLSGIDALSKVSPEIRVRFGLSEEELFAIQAIANDEAQLSSWERQAGVLDEMLRGRPLLSGQEWQRVTQEGLSPLIRLALGPAQEGGTTQQVARNAAINIENASMMREEITRLVRIAGFVEPTADVVRERLTNTPKATFAFDASATEADQKLAAEQVQPVRRSIATGQKIFGRGDLLTKDQLELFEVERREFAEQGGARRLIARRAAVFGMVGVLTVLLAGYIAQFCPKIAQRPARIGWLTLVLTVAFGSACLLGVFDPRLVWLGSLTPVVLIAVLLCVAYDQRTSLAISAILALFVTLALRQHVGMFALMLIGIAAAVSQLREIRERRTLIRMSIAVAIALGGASMLDQIISLPAAAPTPQTRSVAILSAGAQSFLSGLLVGGIALFILPFVEKAFDITTGMTLIELRDPKQPLLRELQQRAPGTYNHSLNVASIAESAAESIGADSLLTYVGCLYHDIGKMNKPGYFVENQSGGPNKHDKLNPAMSLLVIIGHVKDGMEIARAHNLPRNLRHFIEAHHGTTLVEYFYQRAKKKAENPEKDAKPGDPASKQKVAESVPAKQSSPDTVTPIDSENIKLPNEVDYRYPGPRPRTKEVAITMLSDAVESATRTLAEPTPARIDALVRELANRRLMDGQFDNCDLTLRELSTICDSISKTVSSIYHGRVRYASTSEPGEDTKSATAKKTDPAMTRTGGEDRSERRA
jgi:cyclic-di-AMP phosphodiesterase PgpH